MPKMKTKSGCKKRFTFTASGQIKHGVAKKRHNMRKRCNRMLRQSRRTEVMDESDRGIVLKYMPYNR